MVLSENGHLSVRTCVFCVLNMWLNVSVSVFDRTLSLGKGALEKYSLAILSSVFLQSPGMSRVKGF